MADLKRWFKVWTAILDDPGHVDLSLEDTGRWTRLGALTALAGRGGRLMVKPPAKRLLQVLETDTIEAAKVAIKRLPNVLIEEGKSDNGGFAVTWKNWNKYQADSTGYERLKRLRSKRRGEEKREEEKRGDEKEPPVVPQGDHAFEAFWAAYPKQTGKGKAEKAWQKIRPSAALSREILAALEQHKAGKDWRKDGGQFIPLPATWLNQTRWKDTVAQGPVLSSKTQGNLSSLQAFADEANRDPR